MHGAGRSGLDGRRSSARAVSLFAAGDRQPGGWWLPCPASFIACWDGGLGRRTCKSLSDPPAESAGVPGFFAPIVVSADMPSPLVQATRITSHFGNGIVTFSIPYLFRTPRGINLWVKGRRNYFKDGVQPLEGIVETDWLPATFTMNWKLTRPNHSVRFERGEPICMVVPIPRGLAEQLEPVYVPLTPTRSWRASIANGRSRDQLQRRPGGSLPTL